MREVLAAVLLLSLSLPISGLDISKFGQAHQQIEKEVYTNIDSMLVYQNNELLVEIYYGQFNKNSLHRTHSTFKGITALLILIAMDQNLLNPDELVLPLLTTFAEPKTRNEQKAKIRVEHLLNMTSGLDCDESPYSDGPSREWGVDEGPAPLRYALNIPMKYIPGEQWHYCSANSFMLAAVLSAALKRANKPDIFHFAQTYLFTPLGISKKDYRLRYSADGKFLMGQGNSNFKSTDLAKFGQLILNKGTWKNKRIISETAISHIYQGDQVVDWLWTDGITGHPETKTTYGYQWYQTVFEVRWSDVKRANFEGAENNETEKKGSESNETESNESAIQATKVERINVPVYHSWGNGGQFIFIIPSLNAVAVFTGSNQGHRRIAQQKQPFDIMARYILPGLINGAQIGGPPLHRN